MAGKNSNTPGDQLWGTWLESLPRQLDLFGTESDMENQCPNMGDYTPEEECWNCKHKRDTFTGMHVACLKPNPDLELVIEFEWQEGYPTKFDPSTKTSHCKHFEERP